MPKVTTVLGRRLEMAGMTYPMLAFITNIPMVRLEEYARNRVHLTDAELDRVDRAIRHKSVVFTLWRRVAEDAGPVTISTGKDGVMKVEAGV